MICDREKETKAIVSLLSNDNNIALISPRRVGKTDLMKHCLSRTNIEGKFYTFIIDIYATRSLANFTAYFGKQILEELKPLGRKAWSAFVTAISSIKACISYDAAGMPSWTVGIGGTANPNTTLDEIFKYLNGASKPGIVVIDEFQQIQKYLEGNVEALLRTYVQSCSNIHFVFSGSQRHIMGTTFTSPAHPFYQSSASSIYR